MLAVSGPHWVCRRSRQVCSPSLHFWGSRFLCWGAVWGGPWVACTSQVWAAQVQVLGYSTKERNQLGLQCLPFPGRAAWLAQSPQVGRALITSPSQPLGCLGGRGHGRLRCRVSLLRSWSLTAPLPVDVNRPESQEVLVNNQGPACSLVEDASLGPRLPLSGSGWPRLPPSLGMGRSAAG